MVPSVRNHRPVRPKRARLQVFTSIAAVAAVAALLAAGCGGGGAKRAPRAPVTIARSEKRSVPYELEATGTVEPLRTADVTSQVVGIVTRVAFHEGDDVREGQPLFELDARPFDAAAAQAAAMLARDRAQYITARLDLERYQTLAAQNLVAPGDLDTKRATSDALGATVRADSAALVIARINRGYATIRAPIPGRTGRLLAHEGDVVKASDPTAPLVTINELRPILVRFTVPQSEMAVLRRHPASGMRVEALPGERDTTWVAGRLAFMDNAVDDATGTLLLKGEFENHDAVLWPGQFVRVRLRVYEQPGAVVVPSAAVSTSQKGNFIYVVRPDTTVEARPVTVDRTFRDVTLIAKGLEAGETVVTDGQLRLSPDAKAFIRSVPGASGSAGATGAAGARSAADPSGRRHAGGRR